jgi:hypothetical protein
MSCDQCWDNDGRARLTQVVKAYEATSSDARVVCEMRAYFETRWTVPNWNVDPQSGAGKKPPSILVTLDDLTFALFRSNPVIKRLVARVSDGSPQEPFFKKASEKGQRDWVAYVAAREAREVLEAVEAPCSSTEGHAYASALDRAEQIFELLS